MIIDFNCPMCGKLMKIPYEHWGLTGICNYCHHRVTIKSAHIPETVLTPQKDQTLYHYLRRWFDTYWKTTS
jgi:DNA-directed RNA polymerase subunit RPC12/RpoP